MRGRWICVSGFIIFGGFGVWVTPNLLREQVSVGPLAAGGAGVWLCLRVRVLEGVGGAQNIGARAFAMLQEVPGVVPPYSCGSLRTCDSWLHLHCAHVTHGCTLIAHM